MFHAKVHLESLVPHFGSKQTLIRDIKLSTAPRLFMYHSWSLFTLQLSAKHGTPKCRLCTQLKSLISKIQLSPFHMEKKSEVGMESLSSLEITSDFHLMVFWNQNLYSLEDECLQLLCFCSDVVPLCPLCSFPFQFLY